MNHRIIATGFATVLVLFIGCVSQQSHINHLVQIEPRTVSNSMRIPESAKMGPVIPGLSQGAVPQGMSYWREKSLLFTSHYFDKEVPSCVVSMDWETGGVLRTVQLRTPGKGPHYGHVGGIVVEHSRLWVASDAYLFSYALNDICAGDTATATAAYKTEATESVAFCAALDDMVWAGEFALADKYPTHQTHHLEARDGSMHLGWICGYTPELGFGGPPERILSIPDRVQGMAANSKYIFLSRSYGRRNRSSIEIFHNPLADTPHRTVQTSTGNEVPLWFLDGKNHIRSIDLPPMAENIVIIENRLLVLFESGAQKFQRFGKGPLDHIILLELDELNL